jgi:hypothetical protein
MCNAIIRRLHEPSTWASIGTGLATIALAVEHQTFKLWLYGACAAAVVLGAIMPEQKRN